MEISQWIRDKKDKSSGQNGMMIYVTPTEAMSIISSLAEQIKTHNPNGNRPEFHTSIGYFSIAVNSEKQSRTIALARRLFDMAVLMIGKNKKNLGVYFKSEVKHLEADLKRIENLGHWGT